MNTIEEQIRNQNLMIIKNTVELDNNGDKFNIIETKKNIDFLRTYELSNDDIKDIIRKLTIEDCFAGPEKDRNIKYNGPVFKFCPIFKKVKLYIKIRVESTDKSICISVHEFGLYDEVE